MRLALSLVVAPFFYFAFRFISRLIVETLWRCSPPGWFKDLLGRDRASRAKYR